MSRSTCTSVRPGICTAAPCTLRPCHPGYGRRDHPRSERARNGRRGSFRGSDCQASGHGLLRRIVQDMRRARRGSVGAPVPATILRRLRRIQGALLAYSTMTKEPRHFPQCNPVRSCTHTYAVMFLSHGMPHHRQHRGRAASIRSGTLSAGFTTRQWPWCTSLWRGCSGDIQVSAPLQHIQQPLMLGPAYAPYCVLGAQKAPHELKYNSSYRTSASPLPCRAAAAVLHGDAVFVVVVVPKQP